MKEQFKPKRFRTEALELLELVNGVLVEYADQGYRLTVRQVYYQLVARGHVPNSLGSYKRIGGLVSDGRLAGLLDWDSIEDRARETVTPAHWHRPAEVVTAAAEQYRIDHWADQPTHVEVLVEKQALAGVLEPVARRWDLPFTANKGYASQSLLYQLARRLHRCYHDGQVIRLLYLGDHDPSGLDMDRDIAERLALFTGAVPIEVVRLALTMEQIERYKPPENPAKLTDTRARGYVARYGRSSWELDALEPRMLEELVDAAVAAVIDRDAWAAAEARQEEGRELLQNFAAQAAELEGVP